MLSLPDHSYYYYNATGIREDMCGFEEFTHEPDPFEFRPTPPIILKRTDSPLIGVGAGGGESLTLGDRILLGCKCWCCFCNETCCFCRNFCNNFKVFLSVADAVVPYSSSQLVQIFNLFTYDYLRSINQSKQIYVAPYVASESEARVGGG